MPSPTASHQTISYLARRFSETGIRLNARHGQNFLVDLNLLRLIVERAELDPRDVVLEVGTGTGALAALVAPRVASIVTVEIDPRLRQLASEELFGLTNVVMLGHGCARAKKPLRPAGPGGRRRAVGRRCRAAIQTRGQPSLQRGHACDCQPAGRPAGARLDDRHGPKRGRRPHHGQPRHQGLQRVERLGTEPVPGRAGARAAAQRLLAAAQSHFGHHPRRRRAGAPRGDRRSRLLSRFRPRALPSPAKVPPRRPAKRAQGPSRQAGRSTACSRSPPWSPPSGPTSSTCPRSCGSRPPPARPSAKQTRSGRFLRVRDWA